MNASPLACSSCSDMRSSSFSVSIVVRSGYDFALWQKAICSNDTERYSNASPAGDDQHHMAFSKVDECFWSRISILLDIMHKAVSEEMHVNQRDLYYQVKSECDPEKAGKKLFPSIHILCSTINRLSTMTSLPKCNLGVITSPKGLVYGRLEIIDKGKTMKVNCLREGGYTICGNPNQIRNFVFTCSATCIVIVEKETVFQRLRELGIMNKVHCILITAKGYPDEATRAFVSHLSESYSSLPLYAIVDCNPDGLQILSTYKFGSSSATKHRSDPLAVSQISWLGIHPTEAYNSQLYTAPNFTKHDMKVMKSVMKRFGENSCVSEEWKSEVLKMSAVQHKIDIEIYSQGKNLADYVKNKILQRKIIS